MRADSIVVPAALRVGEVVPLLYVTDLSRSMRYYVEGLGFSVNATWVVNARIRWCRLELGSAAVMLQEFTREPGGKVGIGVSLWFQCDDAVALWREITARGIQAAEPRVGNSMWDTLLNDPDGYQLHFVSPTDVPEETKLSEWKS